MENTYNYVAYLLRLRGTQVKELPYGHTYSVHFVMEGPTDTVLEENLEKASGKKFRGYSLYQVTLLDGNQFLIEVFQSKIKIGIGFMNRSCWFD